MTCDGCSNAVKKLLATETYVQSYELSVPEKWLKLVGPDGIEQPVMTRLSKWATAAKKDLEYVGKTEIATA